MKTTRKRNNGALSYIDLFCGIGGFRLATEKPASILGTVSECVLSSKIDEVCQNAYEANVGMALKC